jgi:hypothetical protein
MATGLHPGLAFLTGAVLDLGGEGRPDRIVGGVGERRRTEDSGCRHAGEQFANHGRSFLDPSGAIQTIAARREHRAMPV